MTVHKAKFNQYEGMGLNRADALCALLLATDHPVNVNLVTFTTCQVMPRVDHMLEILHS